VIGGGLAGVREALHQRMIEFSGEHARRPGKATFGERGMASGSRLVQGAETGLGETEDQQGTRVASGAITRLAAAEASRKWPARSMEVAV
jgi:hypothetical protein